MRTVVLILLISIFGFFLRLWDYDKIPPPTENFDELHYAWAGGTWIREGVPKSWSIYDSYKNAESLHKYGGEWRIVGPIVEKPPLFFWAIGVFVALLGPANVFDVEHNIVRILPLTLSLFTIFLTGLLALRVFGQKTGVVSALVYATVPTVVMGNRFAVTENLLTPLMLAGSVMFTFFPKKKQTFGIVLILMLTAASAATKHVGFVLGLAAAVFYFTFKNYKAVVFALIGVVSGIGLFFLVGFIYDFGLFLSLTKDVRVNTLSGLPQLIAVIFAYPGISAKNRLFFDESVLLGLVLLFSSPFLFKEQISKQDRNIFAFLVVPIVFIAAIVLGQTGSGPFDYFAIYIYPLFPYALILLSNFMVSVYDKKNLFGMLVLLSVLGTAALRFILTSFPREYHYYWQNLLILLFVASMVFFFLIPKYRKMSLVILLCGYLLVNVFAVVNLKNTYEPGVKVLQNVYGSFNE